MDSWLKIVRAKCLFVSLALTVSMPVQADRLRPFSSDGCSSFPDGTIEQNTLWLACCEQHDFTYWKGGSYQQRLEADNALKSCVAEVGETAIALLMLAGVRVGGSPFFPTRFRWGYGWPYPRFYGELTEEELEQIQNATSQTSENSQSVWD